jgi:putative DNA primase/helicase
MVAVDAFNVRAKELLELDLPVSDKGELDPPVMLLDDEARKLWAAYHDEVELELGEYGEYSLIRDVGAKSAENAARIACVFQIWSEGPGGKINAKWMASGIAIAYWHLNEALRLFFQADKPQELQDAELLSAWLTTEARDRLDKDGRLPIVEILHSGPYRLREKARRDAAIKVLTDPEVAHLRLLSVDRRKLLQVNPHLLNRKNRNA